MVNLVFRLTVKIFFCTLNMSLNYWLFYRLTVGLIENLLKNSTFEMLARLFNQ